MVGGLVEIQAAPGRSSEVLIILSSVCLPLILITHFWNYVIVSLLDHHIFEDGHFWK